MISSMAFEIILYKKAASKKLHLVATLNGRILIFLKELYKNKSILKFAFYEILE
jgi:hypothetical protein